MTSATRAIVTKFVEDRKGQSLIFDQQEWDIRVKPYIPIDQQAEADALVYELFNAEGSSAGQQGEDTETDS